MRPQISAAGRTRCASISVRTAKLYDLIWKRAVASQMEAAIMEQVAVDITSPDGNTVLRANGSVVKFDGFLKLYQENQDERAATINDDNRRQRPHCYRRCRGCDDPRSGDADNISPSRRRAIPKPALSARWKSWVSGVRRLSFCRCWTAITSCWNSATSRRTIAGAWWSHPGGVLRTLCRVRLYRRPGK